MITTTQATNRVIDVIKTFNEDSDYCGTDEIKFDVASPDVISFRDYNECINIVTATYDDIEGQTIINVIIYDKHNDVLIETFTSVSEFADFIYDSNVPAFLFKRV